LTFNQVVRGSNPRTLTLKSTVAKWLNTVLFLYLCGF
jgi:hypothetical protein